MNGASDEAKKQSSALQGDQVARSPGRPMIKPEGAWFLPHPAVRRAERERQARRGRK